ncbi:MAG: deoxyribonuclease V [Desulfobacterales bacterium]|nr:deoxyribonuclease V [Desulfobacterales bacterium]
MKPKFEHAWAVTENEALKLQTSLSKKVIRDGQLNGCRLAAGVDVAYQKNGDRLVAAAAVLDVKTFKLVESAHVEDEVKFPYIPGLFSFRELPALIKVLDKLSSTPDFIVCDGQGIAHPRRFGLACHLGVIFDIPTIGCSKTRLTGTADTPEAQRGASALLKDKGEVIGAALRTQDNIKPVYVSIGHRVSLETACQWILRLSPNYRLPETTRYADQMVNAYLKNRELHLQ